jgi:hypothetical protein
MHEERLKLRRENDEPKCFNCKNWFALIRDTVEQPLGKCALTHDGAITADLAVCSRWTQKG